MKQSTISKLEAHEKECSMRYQNIEKRLADGAARFDRLENMMWGVYPFIVVCLAVAKLT